MSDLQHKMKNRGLRRLRVRAKISGAADKPRLSVSISNAHITAQLVDDTAHATLAYVSTIGNKAATGTMTEKAAWVGAEIGKQAKAKKINHVVFDRGSKLYHGRIAALADAARKEGLEF